MRPVALAFLTVIALTALACTGGQPASEPTETASTGPPPEAEAIVATEVRATSQVPSPTGTKVADLSAATPAKEPGDVPGPTLAAGLAPTSALPPAPTLNAVPELKPSPAPAATPTSISTAVPTPTSGPTSEPSPTLKPTSAPTQAPKPPATPTHEPTPTAMPSPTPSPTATPSPTPTPATDPALRGYAPLLAEAAAEMDFVRDGLNAEEKNVLVWADSRLFSNPAFLASRWGPDKWPSDVRVASVQAIPLLMLEIDIEKKTNGRHVVTWGVDSLDRILDGSGIYEGMCTSCYGKDNYKTQEEVKTNYAPIVLDLGHVHREMLKTFAYLALADGEGILARSLMDNGAGDFELLYQRDIRTSAYGGRSYGNSLTLTSFGWRSLSFMSQIALPDGTVESFPTTVYRIIGDAADEQEAVERWFAYIHRNMWHFTGGEEDFGNIYRPFSRTPYTPEPGYLFVGEAGSPSSTGLTVSAFRSIGLKAEQFFSPVGGYRTGAVEINGEWYYHDGNSPLSHVVSTTPEDVLEPKSLPMCFFLAPLDVIENRSTENIQEHCGAKDLRELEPTWVMVRPQQTGGPPSHDRAILEGIYSATGGAGWIHNRNWLSDRPINEWYGVTTFNGRVTGLHLRSNNLTGTIPNELAKLSNLIHLKLSGNQFTGQIPPELGRLTYLNGLSLGANQLTGPIPSELGNLTNLTELLLTNNQLAGEVPSELGNLQNLNGLKLEGNWLSGCIPAVLEQILSDLWGSPGLPFCTDSSVTTPNPEGVAEDREALVKVYDSTGGPNWTNNDNWLSDAPLGLWHGVITGPDGRVIKLHLQRNNLSGNIPPELGNLSELQELILEVNNLSGQIPSSLGNLSQLRRLSIQVDPLSGSIPPQLGNLSSLESLYIRQTPVEGSIPPELGHLSNLREFILENNSLSGEIPASLGNLSSLKTLSISGNQIGGAIPPELGKLVQLETLWFDRNRLSGTIPDELRSLLNLKKLSLSRNRLSGTVPSWLGNLSNLEMLWLGGNPQLSGCLPEGLREVPTLWSGDPGLPFC